MNVFINGMIAITLLMFHVSAAAKSGQEQSSADGRYDYIITMLDPPLVHFDGEVSSLSAEASGLKATGPAFTGKHRLITDTPQAVAYKNFLDTRYKIIRAQAEELLGESLDTKFRYYNLVNGFAARLTPAQAARLQGLPGIEAVSKAEKHHVNTYASPEWIGANTIWNGDNGILANRGEGMIIGMLDSGINFDHPSFADIGDDGFNHTNPLGEQLGLCDDEEVLCNDKLIGVYDFTDEETKGKDTSGHGSHTASLAAGNVLNRQFDFASSPTSITAAMTLKGVASHANLITYKVCQIDDPETTDEDESGCPGSAILQALEQAVDDGVDVVNYSLGSTDQSDPWLTVTNGSTNNSEWFLLLREAGISAALSAGNGGPQEDTMNSPAIVPWALAAGAISHDGLIGHSLDNLAGGNTTPPIGIAGPGITTGTVTGRNIVHAKDFGNALCGTGAQEPPPNGSPTCAEYTNYSGQSNPFAPGTFNGEIVVCDRGSYGRVEKGKNVQLAGAGGYILANTIEQGEITVSDEHCLPAIHIGKEDGDSLRAWLDSGAGHMGRIGPFGVSNNVGVADIVQDFSSRGPNNQFVHDILKPNIVAPGSSIYGAGGTGSTSFGIITGTSMAAPHIAGAAALLKAANPAWTPTQIASALETTATNEIMRNFDGGPATPLQSGNGRPVLGDAANAGLYLNVTGQQFRAANPGIGGDPKTLNLAGLVNQTCVSTCQFTRTVTDLQGGGMWTVNVDSPAIQVSPSQFTLGNAGSQQLTIDVDVSDPDLVGKWVFAEIQISNNTAPTAKLSVAVYSSGGVLPTRWSISSDQSSGFEDFILNGLVPLQQATFTGGGLVKPDSTRVTLNEDPTNTEPFNGDGGNFVVWHEVTADSLYLRARTEDTTAPDIDLYVGIDLNENGVADEFETVCESSSPFSLENCEILNPEAGNYWVLVQNWTESGSEGDPVTLRSAVVNAGDASLLKATGPGITTSNEDITVRTHWDNVHALPGEEWWGGVAIGSSQQQRSNIGIVPVRFVRGTADDDQPLIMSEGRQYRRVIGPQSRFDQLVVDVPDGTSSLTASASTIDPAQNGDLRLRLYRMDFTTALASAPDVPPRPTELPLVGEAVVDSVNGPVTIVEGTPLVAGRYYLVVENVGTGAVAATIQADMAFSGVRSDHHIGWWDLQRGNNSIFQGIDFNHVGSSGFVAWYSYGDDNLQTWYFAQAITQTDRDIWTADLWRLTNDGTNQFITTIGEISITTVSPTQLIMSYRLYGQSGFDRAAPISETTCPLVNNVVTSYSAHWFDGIGGKGGDTDLVIDRAQQQVHYFYDQHGNPRWVTTDGGTGPLDPVQAVLEVRNNCSLCVEIAPTITTIGTLTTTFSSEDTGTKDISFTLGAPLGEMFSRSFDAFKLSDTQVCTN